MENVGARRRERVGFKSVKHDWCRVCRLAMERTFRRYYACSHLEKSIRESLRTIELRKTHLVQNPKCSRFFVPFCAHEFFSLSVLTNIRSIHESLLSTKKKLLSTKKHFFNPSVRHHGEKINPNQNQTNRTSDRKKNQKLYLSRR